MPGVVAPRESSWPTVLGIVCVVIGVLGGLTYGVNLVFGAEAFQSSMSPGYEAMVEATAKHNVALRGTSALSLLLSITLTVGGAKLIQRRASGLRILAAWSVLKILAAIVTSAINYFATRDMMKASLNGTAQPGMGPEYSDMFAAFSVLFSLLFQWALPVFLLIWFRRKTISAETKTWT